MSLLVSLFIFFLCLSLHACNARLFGVIDKGPIAVQFHFSIEDGEKAKSLDHLNPSIGGGTDKDGTIDKSNGGASTTQQPKDSINKLSGHVPIKPFVSVSWRVPPKNHGKTPGFFSDYSQPRTRTPSHN